MHRLLMTSATYRQSSNAERGTRNAERKADPRLEDPDNALLSRMPLTRLDAEALYDSMLAVAGRLDQTEGGPADAVKARPDGLITPGPTPRGGWRRLIYVCQARKQLPTHLENFDYPQMNPNCLERRDSTVAPQALHLMNNGMVQQLSEDFARRLEREAGPDRAKQVERAYLAALGRFPSDAERRLALAALGKFAAAWGSKPDANLRALASFCHALMNSAEFVYVD